MADIKLKDKSGNETTYNGVDRVLIPRADGDGDVQFSISEGGYRSLQMARMM